jgi:hypothetical protein
MYLFTFVFVTPPWAFVVLAGVNYMLGVVSTVAVIMLRQFAEELNDNVRVCAAVLPTDECT